MNDNSSDTNDPAQPLAATKTGEKLLSVPDHVVAKAFALHPHQELTAFSTYDHDLYLLNLIEDKQQSHYRVSAATLSYHSRRPRGPTLPNHSLSRKRGRSTRRFEAFHCRFLAPRCEGNGEDRTNEEEEQQ